MYEVLIQISWHESLKWNFADLFGLPFCHRHKLISAWDFLEVIT